MARYVGDQGESAQRAIFLLLNFFFFNAVAILYITPYYTTSLYVPDLFRSFSAYVNGLPAIPLPSGQVWKFGNLSVQIDYSRPTVPPVAHARPLGVISRFIRFTV